MKGFSPKITLVWIIVAFVTISIWSIPLAAEKKKFSMSTKREKVISENILTNFGEHKVFIKQGVSLEIITESTDPNLIGAEQTVYWQNCAIGRSMNEKAVTITRTKNGDCLYSNRDSTFKLIKEEIVSKVYESESAFQFIGGTGKYEEIKGGGTCRGKASPKEITSKCEGEWEF